MKHSERILFTHMVHACTDSALSLESRASMGKEKK